MRDAVVRLLMCVVIGVVLGFLAAAFICFFVEPFPADAQGVGLFGTSATGDRTNCTQLTSPVVGQTACFDQSANAWKFYTGASQTTAQWVISTATQTGVNNARDFGAVCDGSTDDTVALQLAIDASSPGTVLIPPGTCVTSATLTIANGVRILGSGAGPGGVTTVGASTTYRGSVIEHSGAGDLFNVFGVSGLVEAGVGTTFENLLLRQTAGSGTTGTGRAIVIFGTSDSYKPSWVRIKNVTTETGAGKDDWIWSFYADGAATTGVSSAGIRDVYIENVRFGAGTFGQGAIYCDTCANLFIANGEFNGTNAAVHLTGADASHATTGVFITNSYGSHLNLIRAVNVFQAGGSWATVSSSNNTTDVGLMLGRLTNAMADPLPGTRVTISGTVGTTGLYTTYSTATAVMSNFLQVASGVFLNATQTLWSGANANQTPRCTNGCGISPSVVGTNSAMRVTMGSTGTPRSPFLVLFNGAWNSTPACVAQLHTATTTTVSVTNSTTTGVQVNTTIGPSQGGVFSIQCLGVQ